jgi:hypothetical protein
MAQGVTCSTKSRREVGVSEVTDGRELVLETLPAATVPGTVRALLEQRLALWGLARFRRGELAFDLRLCADELVANACEATPDTAIVFRAVYGDGFVSLGVWDAGDTEPRFRRTAELDSADVVPDPGALDAGHHCPDIGGWGLPLVLSLSSDRGVQRTRPRGKWVWARFDLDV